MLLRSAAQKEPPVVARTQAEGNAQQSGNFQGRQMTVSAGVSYSSAPSGMAPAVNQNKRQYDSTGPLSEAVADLCQHRFQFTLDVDSCFCLSKDYSRLITQNAVATEIDIWLADSSGTFVKKGTIATDVPMAGINQNSADVLFIPCPDAKHGHILAAYEKDGSGEFKKTQELTSCYMPTHQGTDCTTELPLPDCVSCIVLSGDGASVACLTGQQGGAIFGRGPDGKWVNKGNCMRYKKLIFSEDSNHIAVTMDGKLALMSKGADGEWTKTGSINVDTGMWKMAFSPDNHHFIAWLKLAGDHDSKRREYFVALFALNRDNQWVEKMRITKYPPVPTGRYTLTARFSPDGRHLVVCGQDKFDIWSLSSDGRWTSGLKDFPCLNGDATEESARRPKIRFATNSCRFMMTVKTNAVVWGLQGNGVWRCQHAFPVCGDSDPQFSADGKVIICEAPHGNRGLWLEDASGKWGWQGMDFNFRDPVFHPVHGLLALNGPTSNALMFMGPRSDGRSGWEEKERLQLAGGVDYYDFSSDAPHLFMLIYDGDGDQRVVSIWDVIANNSKTGPKVNRYGLRPRGFKWCYSLA